MGEETKEAMEEDEVVGVSVLVLVLVLLLVDNKGKPVEPVVSVEDLRG